LKFAHFVTVLTLVTAIFGMAFGQDAAAENQAPRIDPIAVQYILEGEQLSLTFAASDPDGDPISFGLTSRPFGSRFTDNGDGTAVFEWRPEFTGPTSSEGSPFSLSLWAADGRLTASREVALVVINSNRAPQIDPIDAIENEAGDLVAISVSGFDPDADPLSWELISGPEGLVFEPENKSVLSWQSEYGDSGNHDITIALHDIYGAADTASVALTLLPQMVYGLTVDTTSGYPGELVSLDVILQNLVPLKSMRLLINYDFSALFLSAVSGLGTRVESFEYFTYRTDYNGIKGDVLIEAVADLEGGPVSPNMEIGKGPVVSFKFYITNDYSFSGYSVPVRFVFRDLLNGTDNTFVDADDNKVNQEAINYFDGNVFIKKADYTSLGDINLNGIVFEIADAIYYINYFINPYNFPLNPEQLANSDVNLDGIAATVADLVYFINRLTNPGSVASEKLRYQGPPVVITGRNDNGGLSLTYDAESALGGLALTIETTDDTGGNPLISSALETAGLILKTGIDGHTVRVLLYGEEGQTMPAGQHEFLRLDGIRNYSINKIELASGDGVLLKSEIALSGSLPDGFELYQNYPNPFNPVTEIRFDLPAAAEVNLAVFNLLGQQVRSLEQTRLPAGHHRAVWDGRDESGRPVSSGIYFYRLEADGFTAKRKMLLLK